MNGRTLICFGSRYGSTAEISEKIAEVLTTHDIAVDVVNLKNSKVRDVERYDLVIIGSGIQMGKWTKDALRFIKKNQETLSKRKVALFVSCMSAAKPEKCAQARRDYLEFISADFPDVQPAAMALFGGLIDPTRGNIVMRPIMKAVIKSMTEADDDNTPESIDTRDWEQVRLWAESLSREYFFE